MSEEATDEPRKPLILSASQLEVALDCKRKWWFQRGPHKLPEPRKLPDPRTFGDVIHEVAERWLKADELGRDPETGEEVDLYPEGWTTVISKFGADKGQPRSITEGEAAQIKALIAAAIDEGVLVRSPHGKVEERFDMRLFDPEGPYGATNITGYIDYQPDRNTIEDHKSVKKDKSPWRKTPKKIHESLQMRVYAKAKIEAAKKEGAPIAQVHLAHNQFSKDPDAPVVRKTRTTIDADEVETFWTSVVLPLAERLRPLKKEEDWHEVEGPSKGAQVCNKYGGCPYLKICSGRISIERYAKKIKRKNRIPEGNCRTTQVISLKPGIGVPMSFAEKIAAKKARAAGAAAPPPSKAPEPKPEPAPKTTEPSAPAGFEGDVPPWADESCKACKGTGFSSLGAPCRICDVKAKKAGKPQAKDFEIVSEEGVISWSNGEIEGAVLVLSEQVEVKETEAPAPKPEPKPEPESKPEEEPELDDQDEGDSDDEAEEDPTPAPKKKTKRGRPKKGFTLLIDCYVVKGQGRIGGGSGVIFLDEQLKHYGTELAKANEVESFYDVDCFRRRDELCKHAETIAEGFGTDYVVARTDSVEERELLKALRPLASTVIVGQR